MVRSAFKESKASKAYEAIRAAPQGQLGHEAPKALRETPDGRAIRVLQGARVSEGFRVTPAVA